MNFEAGEKLLKEANEYYEDLLSSYRRKSWNIVVRRSQEVVELSLKALLKMMGIEYPKEHDVGEVFAQACRSKNIGLDEKILEEITEASSKLAKERSPSFYMEKIFSEAQAKEAREKAEKILNLSNDLAGKLKLSPC
jgi:HEPN domain-containing protein